MNAFFYALDPSDIEELSVFEAEVYEYLTIYGIAVANWGATPADVSFLAIDNSGNIITNFHVIQNADAAQVTLAWHLRQRDAARALAAATAAIAWAWARIRASCILPPARR